MTSLLETKISRLPPEKQERIKKILESLEGETCLVSKSNNSPDDRLGLYAQIEQLTKERDALGEDFMVARYALKEAIQQRDALLAALKHLLNAPKDPDAVDQAFAAIASVKGEQP